MMQNTNGSGHNSNNGNSNNGNRREEEEEEDSLGFEGTILRENNDINSLSKSNRDDIDGTAFGSVAREKAAGMSEVSHPSTLSATENSIDQEDNSSSNNNRDTLKQPVAQTCPPIQIDSSSSLAFLAGSQSKLDEPVSCDSSAAAAAASSQEKESWQRVAREGRPNQSWLGKKQEQEQEQRLKLKRQQQVDQQSGCFGLNSIDNSDKERAQEEEEVESHSKRRGAELEPLPAVEVATEKRVGQQDNNIDSRKMTTRTCSSHNKLPLSFQTGRQVEQARQMREVFEKPSSQQEQQRRMQQQQWKSADAEAIATAAAIVQQSSSNNRDWHNNEESSNRPMPTVRCSSNSGTLLNMNLQQQRQVASQTRNNNNNNNNSYKKTTPTTNNTLDEQNIGSFSNCSDYFEKRINSIIIGNDVNGQQATTNLANVAGDCYPKQSHLHYNQAQSLLTTADCGQQNFSIKSPTTTTTPLEDINEDTKNNPNTRMSEINFNTSSSSSYKTTHHISSKEPIPTPRNQPNNLNNSSFCGGAVTNELTVLTNQLCLMNPRLKDLSSSSLSNTNNNNHFGSPNSILSDSTTISTTLITEAAMNSSELIPKLIERLDRKVIVMKEEQLKLMREIESNESSGQRLFCLMKKQLAPNEFEKIQLHANEIEKVTKLILSLKLRLKRVEAELKERNDREQAELISNNNKKSSSQQQQQQQVNENNNNIRVQNNENSSDCATTNDKNQLQPNITTIIRGVSDPTSTIGLPTIKRNHQHHASLQLATSTIDEARGASNDYTNSPTETNIDHNNVGHFNSRNGEDNDDYENKLNEPNEVDEYNNDYTNSNHHQHKLSLTNTQSSSGVSSRVCSPRSSTQFNHHQQQQLGSDLSHNMNTTAAATTTTTSGVPSNSALPPPISTTTTTTTAGGVAKTTCSSSSNSSDSIFNCSDSAIGSTIAGHGGSVTNIEQQQHLHHHHNPKTNANISSQTSLSSSTSSASNHRNQSHLSSNISVSSHSSISSSVPHSSPLVSPASVSGGIGTSSCISGSSTPISSSSSQPGADASCHKDQQQQQHASINNNSPNKQRLFASDNISTDNNSSCESTVLHLLTDTDILNAKRNKLISQLEEAHQLEECIFKRNTIIVQRILKKYYDEAGQGGEIAEFKQFTRLKSLLLKDTHDIADRIDNAELQLTELKQSNPCNS